MTQQNNFAKISPQSSVLSPQSSVLSNNSALKVLYVTHYNSLGGGANLSLFGLMLDLRRRYGVIPSVLIPGEGELADRCRENGIEVFCSKFYGWLSENRIKGVIKQFLNRIYLFRKVLSILMKHKFDIVHTNSSVTEMGNIIAQKFHIPHIWHLREYGEYDYDLHYSLPFSYVHSRYSLADAVIAISQSIRKNFVDERRLCPPEKTRIIYNGIRIPQPYIKRRSSDRINFCISGVFFRGKNQLMAIKACQILKKSTDKFMLHLIGDNNNSYAEDLKRLIASSGLEGNVKFWGFRRDAVEILRDMDVGLMLSKCEAFGRVTVEYMLNYMPVIGVNTGATPEIIIDGETGIICPLDDAAKLAELMLRFITNRELIYSMGQSAREHAVKNFSLERNTDTIYSLYQEFLH